MGLDLFSYTTFIQYYLCRGGPRTVEMQSKKSDIIDVLKSLYLYEKLKNRDFDQFAWLPPLLIDFMG